MNTTQISLKPIGVLLRDAWTLYRKHMNALALVSIIPFIFSAIAMTLHPELAANNAALFGMLVVIAAFNVLNLIFSFLMPLALVETMHEVSQSRPIDVNTAYHKSYTLFIPYLFVVLISGIVILGGSILFLIPGIIVSIYLMFVLFVFLFEKKRGIDALIQSAWYVKGFWWDLFARKLILSILVIVSLIVFVSFVGCIAFLTGFGPAVVGFLVDLFLFMVVIPFAFCAAYVIYKDLHAIKGGVAPDTKFVAETEKLFIILLIIPCILLIVLFVVLNFGPHMNFLVSHHHHYPHGFMGY